MPGHTTACAQYRSTRAARRRVRQRSSYTNIPSAAFGRNQLNRRVDFSPPVIRQESRAESSIEGMTGGLKSTLPLVRTLSAAPTKPKSRRAGVSMPSDNQNSPNGAREPQWLGTESTYEQTVKRAKGGANIAKAYLCGSAPVQNSLLDRAAFQAWVRSRAWSPAAPEKDCVTKGPGRETPGGGISAYTCVRHRPWLKRWGTLILLLPDMRFSATDHMGATCSRLEKNGPDHDREVLPRRSCGPSSR